MSEPVARPGATTGATPEHPPVASTDRRATPPEEGAVPGQTGTATADPEDTWEASPESPTAAEASRPEERPEGVDSLDQAIRVLEDEIRRLKSG